MAIAFLIEFSGVTSDQYDRVLERLDLGGKLEVGQRYHVAGPTDDGFRVVGVWDSPDDFDRFFKAKLGAALEAEGVSKPNVSAWPVHHTLDPSGSGP